MHFDDYQDTAFNYAVPNAQQPEYLYPGLAAEAGEVCDLFAKAIRKGNAVPLSELMKELGDVLWFVSALAKMHGVPLSLVAVQNLDKLALRKALGTIVDKELRDETS